MEIVDTYRVSVAVLSLHWTSVHVSHAFMAAIFVFWILWAGQIVSSFWDNPSPPSSYPLSWLFQLRDVFEYVARNGHNALPQSLTLEFSVESNCWVIFSWLDVLLYTDGRVLFLCFFKPAICTSALLASCSLFFTTTGSLQLPFHWSCGCLNRTFSTYRYSLIFSPWNAWFFWGIHIFFINLC